MCVENFPTRVYGDYTLPAGEYSALIIRLGRGEGDNWWCVVYPPLCFAGGNLTVIDDDNGNVEFITCKIIEDDALKTIEALQERIKALEEQTVLGVVE